MQCNPIEVGNWVLQFPTLCFAVLRVLCVGSTSRNTRPQWMLAPPTKDLPRTLSDKSTGPVCARFRHPWRPRAPCRGQRGDEYMETVFDRPGWPPHFRYCASKAFGGSRDAVSISGRRSARPRHVAARDIHDAAAALPRMWAPAPVPRVLAAPDPTCGSVIREMTAGGELLPSVTQQEAIHMGPGPTHGPTHHQG